MKSSKFYDTLVEEIMKAKSDDEIKFIVADAILCSTMEESIRLDAVSIVKEFGGDTVG